MAGLGESREKRAVRRLRDRSRIIMRLRRRAALFYDCPEMGTSLGTWSDVLRERERYARLHYRNRKRCSGSCCRSARRTARAMGYQEYRAELDARQQCEEVGVRYKGSRFRMRW